MANELLDKPVEFEVNGNDVKLTGNTVAKYLTRGNGNVSEQEVVMFINLCKFQKLNPFLNEAYLIKFGNQPAQIIVSKEAFMKRAESHPQYDGMEAGIIVERGDEMIEIEGAVKLKDDVLIGGWSKIYRKDRTRPVIVKVDLEELSERVSDSCSATPSDCSAVIIGLVTEICRSLDQGNIVRLGQLGSFQVSVQGTSSPSPEEVSEANIASSSIIFRPGKKLKNMLNQLKFYKKK